MIKTVIKKSENKKQHGVSQTWITGPSAKGSEYGTPNSIMSAPQESSTFNASAVVERSGSPAVMYGIRATFTENRDNQQIIL